MNDHDALLAAIITNPNEDTPRLVYADYLQEQGFDERAEFIRVQCEIASLPDLLGWETLRYREEGLFGTRGDWWDWKSEGLRKWAEGPTCPTFVLRRGFIESLTCTPEDWFAHADEIHWHPSQDRPCPQTAQPLRKVTLTTAVTKEVLERAKIPLVEIGANLRGSRWAFSAILSFQDFYKGVEFDVRHSPEYGLPSIVGEAPILHEPV